MKLVLYVFEMGSDPPPPQATHHHLLPTEVHFRTTSTAPQGILSPPPPSFSYPVWKALGWLVYVGSLLFVPGHMPSMLRAPVTLPLSSTGLFPCGEIHMALATQISRHMTHLFDSCILWKHVSYFSWLCAVRRYTINVTSLFTSCCAFAFVFFLSQILHAPIL